LNILGQPVLSLHNFISFLHTEYTLVNIRPAVHGVSLDVRITNRFLLALTHFDPPGTCSRMLPFPDKGTRPPRHGRSIPFLALATALWWFSGGYDIPAASRTIRVQPSQTETIAPLLVLPSLTYSPTHFARAACSNARSIIFRCRISDPRLRQSSSSRRRYAQDLYSAPRYFEAPLPEGFTKHFMLSIH
jgi:hypothetical protein